VTATGSGFFVLCVEVARIVDELCPTVLSFNFWPRPKVLARRQRCPVNNVVLRTRRRSTPAISGAHEVEYLFVTFDAGLGVSTTNAAFQASTWI
jgi:hypothetical protein